MARKLKEIVAENIKKFRHLAGMTQAELAKKSKLTEVYISKIETSPNNLTLDSIEQISNALGISPLQLFESSKVSEQAKLSKLNIKNLKQAVRALDSFLDSLE